LLSLGVTAPTVTKPQVAGEISKDGPYRRPARASRRLERPARAGRLVARPSVLRSRPQERVAPIRAMHINPARGRPLSRQEPDEVRHVLK
jgi:hypothetical protein